MNAKRIVAALLALIVTAGSSGLGLVRPAGAQSSPPPGTGEASPSQATEATPPRISYINGEVSFWRPGAEDWTPAKENMPLAPGDVLYAGPNGNVEVQVGARAFVRAAENTQIGLDNQDPDYVQLRVTAGHAALDVRDIESGDAIELATPSAAFTVERAGYYRLDVAEDAATFRAHRGGAATVTPASGAPVPVSTNQQVVVQGGDSPRVESGLAMELTAWDRWNTQRTDYLIQSATSARYVGTRVYGTEALDRNGTWTQAETYGSVWVPTNVPSGWVPYSTGRWIWDPRYGWTWLDDASWGWAPYHYGRWVFVGSRWGWAPGPLVVRPVYSPALVVFLGGGISVSVGRPVHWAPLSWGEPVIPWWGRPGFIGRPYWGGWGGPRVVNNVVIQRNTTVNVTNINVYRNVTVNNAVVGVPADRFGHGQVRPVRVAQAEVQRLTPQHGGPGVRPVAASVTASTGTAATRPPEAMQRRPVVATRPAHDVRPALREEGLTAAPASPAAPAARIVPSPRAVSPQGGARGPEPVQGSPGIAGPRPGAPAERPQVPASPGVTTPDRRQGTPADRSIDRRQTTPPAGTPSAPSGTAPAPAPPGVAGPRPGAPATPPPAPASPGAPRVVTPPERDARPDARTDPRRDRPAEVDRRQAPPQAPAPGQVAPARPAPPAPAAPAPAAPNPSQVAPPRAPRGGEEGQVPRAVRPVPAPAPAPAPRQEAPPQQQQAPPQRPQIEQGGPGRSDPNVERDQRRGPSRPERPDAPAPGTPRSDQRRPGEARG